MFGAAGGRLGDISLKTAQSWFVSLMVQPIAMAPKVDLVKRKGGGGGGEGCCEGSRHNPSNQSNPPCYRICEVLRVEKTQKYLDQSITRSM